MLRPTRLCSSSALACIALAGCGRFAFEARPDADADADVDAAPPPATGILDPAFGTGGVTFVSSPTYSVSDVGRRTSGYVLIGTYMPSAYRMLLAGFTPDGALDPAFGASGLVDAGSTMSDFGYAVLSYGDRLIVVGDGYRDATTLDDAQVAAFDQAGAPIPAFGTSGYTMITRNGTGDTCHQIRYSDTGPILASEVGYSVTDSMINVVELGFNGSIQAEHVDNPFPGQHETVRDLLVLADGVLVIGWLDGVGMLLVKYTTGFARDPGFGTGGIVTTTDGAEVRAGGRLPNGELVVVGGILTTGYIARLSAAGEVLDSAMTSFGSTEQLRAVAVTSTGFVVAGSVSHSGSSNGLIARYLADGTLDPSFGSNGSLEIDAGADEELEAIKVESDGSYIIAGTRFGGGMQGFIARVR